MTEPKEKDKLPPILYKNGKEYTQAPSTSEVVDRPSPGVYTLKVVEGLVKLIRDPKYTYSFPSVIYGSAIKNGDMIIRRWVNNPKNTGALLSGHQGTGKSLTSQYVIGKAIELGAVVIVVTEPLVSKEAFDFIQGLQCPVVIFIDEFEKKYKVKEQEDILGYLDGGSLEGVLWLLTANSLNRVQDHYLHRPSRIYFHFRHDNVDLDTVKSIVNDKLDLVSFKKHHKDVKLADFKKDIVKAVSMFSIRTFDAILAFIGEINTSGNGPFDILKYMNIERHQRSKEANTVYYRIFTVGEDEVEDDVTSEYNKDGISRFTRWYDVFDEGNGYPVNDDCRVMVTTNNQSLPNVQDFQISKDTFVYTENLDIQKYLLGETLSGKKTYLEFSKKPYPKQEKKDKPKEVTNNNLSPLSCIAA